MVILRPFAATLGTAAISVAVLLALAVPTASAAEPACTSKAMYVVAHQDDTLLFQSPSVLQDIQSERCVRTVFLTAGDAGKGPLYWEGREVGAEAAYAEMAGVADEWTGSQISANGNSIQLETLDAEPGISIAYMRLPDGGESGGGTATYGFESLEKLWKGGQPGGDEDETVTAVDDSASYDYDDLIETLAALMDSFQPRQIETQNYTQAFVGPDHPDHVGSGYFVKAAQELYGDPHRLVGFEDYETASKGQNVFGGLLEAKQLAFYKYGAHDSDACSDESHCANTSYAKWLLRQYVAATQTTGVVANAGYAQQEANPSTAVSLDGSQSSDESGNPLQFQWAQTGGPAVVLSGTNTTSPTFLTPPHPTLLTFSLTVRDGLTASPPDFVRVRVPTTDPTPVAAAGSAQTVASGATVSLDGSASWDPNSLPLGYAWTQTGGPPVVLSGSTSPAPSFAAPTGPATLTFSLVVSNGTQSSAPATVAVEVNAPDPAQGGGSKGKTREDPDKPSKPRVKLSSSKVRLLTGRSARRVVRVQARTRSSVKCSGALPKGARCRVTATRNLLIESSSALSRPGTYRLTVHVSGPDGTAKKTLIVQVQRPSGRSVSPRPLG
jgi:LmbE family N-acetylglucosaminyl deacetylase